MVKYSKVENARCYAVELRETGEILFKFTKKNKRFLTGHTPFFELNRNTCGVNFWPPIPFSAFFASHRVVTSSQNGES